MTEALGEWPEALANTRKIADRGRYPAINVLKSISRLMPMCHTAEENVLVGKAREHGWLVQGPLTV